MKYEFELEDYEKVMKEINAREDVAKYGFRRIRAAKGENSELQVYGFRIVIPELDMTVREGTAFFNYEDGEEVVESHFIYCGDEPNPVNISGRYSSISLEALIGMLADSNGENPNPVCCIDDAEFELGT